VKRATFILFLAGLAAGGLSLLGFLPAGSLLPAILIGAAMVLALLDVVNQSDQPR
jgi:hypothetical protein